MPCSGNCSHDFRSVLGQPAENEECATNAVPIERGQQRIDTTRYATRLRKPLVG